MLDAKWLELFKLPLRTAIAVALACCALLALVFAQILDLGLIGPIALPVLIIAAVVSTAMSIVGSVNSLLAPWREKHKLSALELRRAVRRNEQHEQREQRQAVVLSRLEYLSKEEISVVVDALLAGSPSFYTYIHSPPVTLLMGKGLVWTPGGAHHQDYYPFSFVDFVWTALVGRKDEFVAKHDEHKRAEEDRRKAEFKARR